MEPKEDHKFDFEIDLNICDLRTDKDLLKELHLVNEEGGEYDSHSSGLGANIEHYCRVCGSENSNQNLIFIFGKRGIDLALEKKIFDHLHLEVIKNDCLPQKICLRCVSHLHTWQQFLESCQTAASKLRQLFLLNKEKEGGPSEPNMNGVVSTVEQDQENSSNTGELGAGLDDSKYNESDDKTPSKTRKKDKLRTSVLCHVCGKAFKDMSNLHAHKRTHLPENLKKKFQCTICAKSFRTNFHVSEHMNMHLGVTPYACPDCDKRFHSRALLRQHAQMHRARADDKHKVACPKCGLLCTRKGNLRAHMRTHLEGRTFACCVCQRQFPSFSDMLSHRKQHSQDEIKQLLQQNLIKDKDRIFPCQLCDKIFTDKRILMTHVERMHDGAPAVKYECGDCGKTLHSQRSLAYHQRSQHTGERPHRCSYCGEGFLLLKLLKAHETKHTGERPFKCHLCGKGFRSRNNLNQHSQKHGGERKFQCMVCGKNFQRKGSLDVHSRIHSGEKPFVCDQCGRGFTQKNDLMKHQRTHTEGSSKTRTCEQCLTVFGSKKELIKHKEESHRNGVEVVPLIVANNIYETHIITEDGQKIVFPTVDATLRPNTVVISSIPDISLVQ